MRLTRRTLLNIFRQVIDKEVAMSNPQEFAASAVRIIKEKLADHLIKDIKYEKIDDWYEMTQLEVEQASWKEHLVSSAKHSIYDQVICDSDVEKIRRWFRTSERCPHVLKITTMVHSSYSNR